MMDILKGEGASGGTTASHGRQCVSEAEDGPLRGRRIEGDGGESSGWVSGEGQRRRSVGDGDDPRHRRGMGDGREEKWSNDGRKEGGRSGPRWRDYVDRRDIKSWLWKKFSDDKSSAKGDTHAKEDIAVSGSNVIDGEGYELSTFKGATPQTSTGSFVPFQEKSVTKSSVTKPVALKPVWYPPLPFTKPNLRSGSEGEKASSKSGNKTIDRSSLKSTKSGTATSVHRPGLLPKATKSENSEEFVQINANQLCRPVYQDVIRGTEASTASQLYEQQRQQEYQQRLKVHQQQKLQLYQALMKRRSQASAANPEPVLSSQGQQHVYNWTYLNQVGKAVNSEHSVQENKSVLKDQSNIYFMRRELQLGTQNKELQSQQQFKNQISAEVNSNKKWHDFSGQEQNVFQSSSTQNYNNFKQNSSNCTRPSWIKENNCNPIKQHTSFQEKTDEVGQSNYVQKHSMQDKESNQLTEQMSSKQTHSLSTKNEFGVNLSKNSASRPLPSTQTAYVAKMISNGSVVPWLQILQSQGNYSNQAAKDNAAQLMQGCMPTTSKQNEMPPSEKFSQSTKSGASDSYKQNFGDFCSSSQPPSSKYNLPVTSNTEIKGIAKGNVPIPVPRSFSLESNVLSHPTSVKSSVADVPKTHNVLSATSSCPTALMETKMTNSVDESSLSGPFNPFTDDFNPSSSNCMSLSTQSITKTSAPPPKPPRLHRFYDDHRIESKPSSKYLNTDAFSSKPVYLNPPATSKSFAGKHDPLTLPNTLSETSASQINPNSKSSLYSNEEKFGNASVEQFHKFSVRNSNQNLIKSDLPKAERVKSSYKMSSKPPNPRYCPLRSKMPPPKPKRTRRYSVNSKVLSHPVSHVRSCSPGPFIRQNILHGLLNESELSHLSKRKETSQLKPECKEKVMGTNRRGTLRRNSFRTGTRKQTLPRKGIMKHTNQKAGVAGQTVHGGRVQEQISHSTTVNQPLKSRVLSANKNENLTKPPIRDKGLEMFEERNRRLSLEEGSEDENMKEEKNGKVSLESFRREVVREGREKFMALEAKEGNIGAAPPSAEKVSPQETSEKANDMTKLQPPRHVRFGEVTKIYEFTEAARLRLAAGNRNLGAPMKYPLMRHRRVGSDPILIIPDPDPAPLCTPSDPLHGSLFSKARHSKETEYNSDTYVTMREIAEQPKVPGVYLDDNFQAVLWDKLHLKQIKDKLKSSSSCEDFSSSNDGLRNAYKAHCNAATSSASKKYQIYPKPWFIPSPHAPLQRSASDNIGSMCHPLYQKEEPRSSSFWHSKAQSDLAVEMSGCRSDDLPEMFADNPMYGQIYPDDVIPKTSKVSSATCKASVPHHTSDHVQTFLASSVTPLGSNHSKITEIARCACSECCQNIPKKNNFGRSDDDTCRPSAVHKLIASFDGPCLTRPSTCLNNPSNVQSASSFSTERSSPPQKVCYQMKQPLHRSPRFNRGYMHTHGFSNSSFHGNQRSTPSPPKRPPKFYISESESETEAASYPVEETCINVLRGINSKDSQDEPEWRVSILQALKSLEEGGKTRTAVSASVTMTKVVPPCHLKNWATDDDEETPDVTRRPALVRSLSGPDVLESCRAHNISVTRPSLTHRPIRHTSSQSCVSSMKCQDRFDIKKFRPRNPIVPPSDDRTRVTYANDPGLGSSSFDTAEAQHFYDQIKTPPQHLRTSSLGEDAAATVHPGVQQHSRAASLVQDYPSSVCENRCIRIACQVTSTANSEYPLATSSPKVPRRSID
ncbi:uncharacterized protein, partial [Palaemon carinicauda]|uniref:uncharacterized protein n=1 Tax=Palaemon carinicauda TaxID=392227 RepID=UPI0035B64B65